LELPARGGSAPDAWSNLYGAAWLDGVMSSTFHSAYERHCYRPGPDGRVDLSVDVTSTNWSKSMKAKPSSKLKDGAHCKVVGGTHAGKSGSVTDIKTGKTGHVSITVVQKNGDRFKTLAKNVVV
jgi:hypothetical protein